MTKKPFSTVQKMWAVVVVISVFLICYTIVFLNAHPYALRFEMDNNTLEAMKIANQTVARQDYERGLQEGRGDVSAILKSITPPKDCVLIIIDEHSKNEVCKGDKLYAPIMEDWSHVLSNFK